MINDSSQSNIWFRCGGTFDHYFGLHIYDWVCFEIMLEIDQHFGKVMDEKSIALSKLLVRRRIVMLKDEESTLFMVAL